MVHEALQHWRKTNFSGPAGDPALSLFLTQNMASREGTPNTGNAMPVDSPFSLASLSPLSPLVALYDSEIILEACIGDLTQLVDTEVPMEFFVSDEESAKTSSDIDVSSNHRKNIKEEDEEWTNSPRRSLRRKTKRINNVTSTRSSRRITRKAKRTSAPEASKKKSTQMKATVDEVFVAVPEGASRKCSCKKSKCLKLYCECFAAGVLCDPGCKCSDCSNTADNVAARRKAVAYKLSRKPRAFQEKIVETTGAKDGAIHSKGCNCKRSGCQKKYCECYQGGVACSDSCKCQGCKNDGALMHLRDLGVTGWKAPDGGFRQSAYGLMSTMIVMPPGRVLLEDPIPVCDTEIALERFLLTEHFKRGGLCSYINETQLNKPEISSLITSTSNPVWPVAKPAQVTPRSGTVLEPYPDNLKRRCDKKTPKSFGVKTAIDDETDGWLVELGDTSSVLSTVAADSGEKLSKGIKFLAQWSDGDWGIMNSCGTVGSANQAIVDSVEIDTNQAIVDSVEIDTNMGGCSDLVLADAPSSQDCETSESLLGAVQNVESEPLCIVDQMMQEIEVAMVDLLTPRLTDLLTPRLADFTPRSCRSSATPRSYMDAEFDWDQLVSPRASPAC